MIKYFNILWCLCLVVIDASPVAAPGSKGVPDLQSACARIDIWGLSEVAKALCGAVDTRIKCRGRPVCSCSRCATDAGGGIGCALSGKKWNQQQSNRKQIDTQESLFLLSTPISSSRICSETSTTQTSLIRKLVYLADHRPEKNLDEYVEAILCLYPFCDRITSSAKRVHICWITNLHISAPNLLHSPAYFLLKQPRLDKKWYPSMSVRNAD